VSPKQGSEAPLRDSISGVSRHRSAAVDDDEFQGVDRPVVIVRTGGDGYVDLPSAVFSALEVAARPDLQEDEQEALRYFIDVLKGLACRPLKLLPEEVLTEGALRLQRRSDLARWVRYHNEAWQLWRQCLERVGSEEPALGEDHCCSLLPKRSPLVAVMIEMREHPDLELVLRKTMAELQPGAWALLVVCGQANEDHARRAASRFPSATVRPLATSDLSAGAYANFRRSETLLRMIEDLGGKTALFFECDAVLLRPGVERFLGFDLVGAPWSWAVLKGDPCCVGNGGLSLRSVAFMRAALRHMGASPDGEVEEPYPPRNEDMCFARAAWEMGARVPDVEVAAAFSVETLFHPRPVGCHKPWQYLLPSDLRRIFCDARGGGGG